MKRHEQHKGHTVTLHQQQQAQSAPVPRIVSAARWKKTISKVISVHAEALKDLADR
ncbi:MAG: hypothetical protein WAK31_27805 [Chthoniobacterales bacterium]